MACAHHMHLAMNPSMLPLEACGLARIELATAKAVGNASLLVELALDDVGFLRGRRRCLCDGDGRRRKERRHKCELRESHGVFLLLWRRCFDHLHWLKHRVPELVFNRKVEAPLMHLEQSEKMDSSKAIHRDSAQLY